MKRISNDFKGVIHVGKTKFTAGSDIPESFVEKMDMDSLMEDGIVVDDSEESDSPLKNESGEKISLEDMNRADLLEYANEELELGIPVRTGKPEILETIRIFLKEGGNASEKDEEQDKDSKE